MAGVYRVWRDPLQGFRIRVRIRLIQDAGRRRFDAEEGEENAERDVDAESQKGRLYQYEFKWQERVDGPRHALRGGRPKRRRRRRDDGEEEPKERTVEEDLKERGHRLFTHVARDNYSAIAPGNAEPTGPLVRDGLGRAAPLLQTPLAASTAPRKTAAAAGHERSHRNAMLAHVARRENDDPGVTMYSRRAELPTASRGDAAAVTWIFRGDEPRRGRSVEQTTTRPRPAPALGTSCWRPTWMWATSSRG